jgi:hypothetical protein
MLEWYRFTGQIQGRFNTLDAFMSEFSPFPGIPHGTRVKVK